MLKRSLFLLLISTNFLFCKNIIPLKLKETILEQGGSILLIIILLSLFAFTMIFYLALLLRREFFMPSQLREKIDSCLNSKDYFNLARLCKKKSSPLARINYNVFSEIIKDEKNIDNELIYKLYEQQGKIQNNKIEQKFQYILNIASLAPMIGLLGTVLGMYEAFANIQVNFKGVNPIVLANGISKALVTTIAGISLSIILNFFYGLLNNRKKSLFAKLESFCLLSYKKIKK